MSKGARRHLLFIGLALLLTIPLAILLSRGLKGFARDLIVVPFLYILWIGRLLLRSIPQSLLWAIFLMFALLIAIRSLIEREGRVRAARELEEGQQGRVRELARHIELAERSGYFQWRVARRLRELIVETVSHSERRTSEQVKQALDELDAPPEVGVYLQAGHTLAPPSDHIAPFARLVRFLRGSAQTSSPDSDPERVVQFLEDRLGVQR